jgi:hypothetical protein
MFTRHISRQLTREERELVSQGMEAMKQLPLVEAPDSIWFSIEGALVQERPRRRWILPVAAFALAVFALILWQVALRPVRWIETDATSRVLLKIGDIGSVEVGPNTRVRVVSDRAREHRLALARGQIMAKISAPPKLFFVDTPSGTAVDLGCEYTLNADENGLGLLRVTKGWVSFEWKGSNSLVPAGASCRTRPETGPGVPYFDDAPEKLKQAVEAFGFEKSAEDTLGIILAESRVRDTLTLWHLLSRVEGPDRERVFDRMVALTPLPPGVTREKALQLDPQTLEHWREELAWTW